jgi:acetyl esterase
MVLDPQSRAVLERTAHWAGTAELTVPVARELDRRRARELGGQGPELPIVQDIDIEVASATLRGRLYRPTMAPAPGLLVWFHGGGWVTGSIEGSDVQTRALAQASACAVLSVEYRLAPEHPFPTPVEDCFAALEWAHLHAPELGARSGAVAAGGDSAGGNLAAAASLMARDRGGPAIALQLLVYPNLCRYYSGPSRTQFDEGYWLTGEGMEWHWEHYLPTDADARDPYVSPLLATSFAGLPPAHLLLAECDLLRDEALAYAEKLTAAGIPARAQVYEGMLHGFMACAGVVDRAWDAFTDAGDAIRNAFSGEPQGATAGSSLK